jgi:dipeptidyl aminopeptidase/acylaminoacyl peptidase
VNISNSQTIFDAFKKNNVKTDFITLPGAVHGFRGEDEKRAMAATVSWFEQTLVKQR